MSVDFHRWAMDMIRGQNNAFLVGERLNNSMQQTAQRTAADAERCMDSIDQPRRRHQ